MLNKVRSFIQQNRLLDRESLYIVALSGGADSVALLLMLHEMGYCIHAAHCNFHLRGEESERDEHFCQQLCEAHGIPLHRIHFDTQTYAHLHHQSIELAARELRYGYFEQLRMDIGAQGVCVAHHRDDAVETVLMNLVRGTGLHGLTGIRVRNGNILRPMLCLSRTDIETFLTERGQPFVTDSTNLEDEATRNKVRHHLVPLLRELNPKAVENIQRMAERMQAVEQVVDERLAALKKGHRIDMAAVLRSADSDYLVYELIRDYGFNSRQAADVYECMKNGQSGRVFASADYQLLVDRREIIIEKPVPDFRQLVVPEEGNYLFDGDRHLRLSIRMIDSDFEIPRESFRIAVDADKVRFPLVLRRVKKGDTMVPFGMKGHKLVSDLMTDRKMNVFDKQRQLVMEDANGVLVWLVGIRPDNRVAVTGETHRLLLLQID